MSIETIHLPGAPTLDLGPRTPKPTALSEGQFEASCEFWSADELNVGVWECSPGKFSAVRDGYHEICYIMSGTAVIAADGGTPRTVRGGDTVVMPAGWKGTWDVIETVRKTYVTLDGIR